MVKVQLHSSPSHAALPLVAVFRVEKYCGYLLYSLFFQITEYCFDLRIIRILILATFDNLTVVTLYLE